MCVPGWQLIVHFLLARVGLAIRITKSLQN
jgi:hypothetical protein